MFNKKFWTEGYGSFAIAIGVALTIRWAVMEAYVIPSGSMLPTLLIHDHIFVNKMVYGVRVPFSEKWLVKFKNPEPGEIIVFKYPLEKSTFFIKRVVGVGGDRIEYREGKIYRNGTAVEQTDPIPEHVSEFNAMSDRNLQHGGDFSEQKGNFLHLTESLNGHKHSVLLERGAFGHTESMVWEVPEGKIFVMGDNRENSSDSREWGLLSIDRLIGQAWVVYWPSNEISMIPHYNSMPFSSVR